jgi:hypothetical protein
MTEIVAAALPLPDGKEAKSQAARGFLPQIHLG